MSHLFPPPRRPTLKNIGPNLGPSSSITFQHLPPSQAQQQLLPYHLQLTPKHYHRYGTRYQPSFQGHSQRHAPSRSQHHQSVNDINEHPQIPQEQPDIENWSHRSHAQSRAVVLYQPNHWTAPSHPSRYHHSQPYSSSATWGHNLYVNTTNLPEALTYEMPHREARIRLSPLQYTRPHNHPETMPQHHTPQDRDSAACSVVLKRKNISPGHDEFFGVSPYDSQEYTDPNHKRSKQDMQSNRPERAESHTGQWRVGKMPGHQGSHVKASEETGSKRTLSESINDSAERVLKKPFRTPGIVLAKAPPKLRSPQSHISKNAKSTSLPFTGTSDHTSAPTRLSRGTGVETQAFPLTSNRFPLSKSSPIRNSPAATPNPARNRKNKLSKPFRTPVSFAQSSAPSPDSTMTVVSNRETSPPSANVAKSKSNSRTSALEIANLEKQVLNLRQAIRYTEHPDEDEQIKMLITMWREAGRNVAEQLFQLVPDPTSSSDGLTMNRNYMSNGWNSTAGTGLGLGLNDEQREYLKNAPTNDDGDAVDEEGNVLLEEPLDIMEILEGGKRYGKKRGIFGRIDQGNYELDTQNETVDTAREWNIGNMMLKFQVDPALLGWENEIEDWAVMNEDD